MYGNEYHVSIAIHNLYRFLHPSSNVGLHQSAEHSNSVVYVHDEISHVITVEVFNGEPFAAFYLAAELYPVVSFKNLVVRVNADLRIRADKPFARGTFQMFKLRVFSLGNPGRIPENIPDSFCLVLATGTYINGITF